jgi:hypothetical protein
MSTKAATARLSSVSAIAGLVLGVLAVGTGWLLWRRPAEPPPRSAPGAVVLEASLDLTHGAVDRRLLAPGPSIFDIEVTAPDDVRVTFGPPAPSTREAEGGPAPETATRVSDLVNGTFVGRVRAYAAGIWVLRVEPAGKGASARVRVVRRPGP